MHGSRARVQQLFSRNSVRNRAGLADGGRAAGRVDRRSAAPIRHIFGGVSTRAPDDRDEDLELPIEELLRRARPLPPHDEMVMEDLSEDEGVAFLAAVQS